jgi:deoxycitidine kinase/deoxyguanosine kinase
MDSPVSVKTSNLYTPSTIESRCSSDADVQSRFPYKIVSIEGNIGSGKTTLLANIKKTLGTNKNVIFLKEPVDDWETIRDAEGRTMLQKFYADQEKYSFPFQMMAYITRLTLLRTAIRQNPNSIIITERSLYTDKMVFAKMLHDTGKIEDVNYAIYLRWFNDFVEECPVEQIVYVKAEPDVCHARIAKRSRAGESGIPLAYLEECHKYHEAMLDMQSEDCVCRDQLVLNGNLDIYENESNLKNMLDQVLSYVDVDNFMRSKSSSPLHLDSLLNLQESS